MTAAIFLPIVGIFALLALFWAGLIRKKSAALSASLLSMTEQQDIQKRNLDLYRGRDHCLFYDGCEAMFIFDQNDGALLEANREATQLLGYTTDEVRELNFKALS